MKRTLLSLSLIAMNLTLALAQGPNGSADYYQAADGLKGAELKTKLFTIISKKTKNLSYDDLLEKYKDTDTRADGYVRDWYSNATNFTHIKDKAGNYQNEGDVYNREHTIPQSWGAPKADIIHVVPTDGWVNGMRGDKPFGEVGNVDSKHQSANGYSKWGTCKTAGYSGEVFEPNDEIKGDLARIYFYMATCYETTITSWSGGGIITGTKYQPYEQWQFDMLLRWSQLDPVDAVEVARNNAIARKDIQGNRNPFVDYPGLEQYVWGDKAEEPFSYDGSDATVMPEVTPAVTTEISLNNKFFGVGWTGSRDYWDRSPMVGEQDGVSITYCRGIEGKDMYVNNQQMRLYTNNTLTFRTEENEMTNIELNVVQNDQNRVFTASTGEMDGYTWTGNAKEVQFQLEYASAGVVRINKVKVEVTETTGIQMATVQTVYDGYTYNLMGVRVDADQLRPGIYIRNGKKFVIR